jgi:Transglutaminase-like superfamily
MRLLLRFFRLDTQRKGLLLVCCVLLPLTRIALLLLPFRLVQRFVLRTAARQLASKASAADVDRVLWSISVASAYLPGASCLPQALAGQFLLARVGQPSNLRLGAKKDGANSFHAHAWLEHDGKILLGGETAADYVRMPMPGQDVA